MTNSVKYFKKFAMECADYGVYAGLASNQFLGGWGWVGFGLAALAGPGGRTIKNPGAGPGLLLGAADQVKKVSTM